jgi:hypothetical protein
MRLLWPIVLLFALSTLDLAKDHGQLSLPVIRAARQLLQATGLI